MNHGTLIVCCALAALAPSVPAAPATRPNILWLTSEDHGPQMGCYGDKFATTPNIDRLAAKGMIYARAWSCAPVCAPARTTIISGMFPTATGSEHMRSSVDYPAGKKMFPQFLREAGYYCSNNAKEDYNLEKPDQVWDESSGKAHWRNRQAGQPFFAVFNATKSHESQVRARPHTLVHDPAKVRVPAYHPDTPEVRHDWAQYYDVVSAVDADAGKRLAELAEAGLAEDTIVFYYGDHGPGMPRCKRWPYNSGLHVPLVVYVPEKFKELRPPEYKPGGKSDRLVSFVDLAPTVLSLASIQPPEWMHGHAFMGKFQAPPQPYIYGFRGRMDERYDMVRTITDGRYVYLRQYLPHLVYGQYINYMFQTPTTQVWKQLSDAGKLQPPQTFFWERKPPEELYDLQTDPDEVKNLANSPAHRAILENFRQAQRAHTLRIRDVGFLTEAEQHSRAGKLPIHDMAQDPKQYPIEKIFAMAELAASLTPGALAQLTAGLKDDESGVRYWAAMGFVMRGKSAPELRAALADASPSVRVAAAQALAQAGSADELGAALAVLKELAPPDKNGAYVAMLALNAIDQLGDKAAGLRDTIKTIPTKDPNAVSRANGYVDRLVEHIGGADKSAARPEPRQPKKPKRSN